MESSFQVSTHQSDCCRVIELAGDLDLATAPAVTAVLEEIAVTPPDHMIVQVSGLGFIDSTGLRVLISASQLVGGRIWLEGCSPQLKRLIDLTSVTELFCLEEDKDLAHRLISTPAG